MKPDYLDQIREDLLPYETHAQYLRRLYHRCPESGFQEHMTQALIRDYLEKLGYEPEEVIGTGLALYIPANSSQAEKMSCVALRTDMDGLCVTEPKTDENARFRSETEGMMHACGHDGHITMVLLVARYLAEHPDFIHRPVLLIFQPAEEGPGGAGPMCESGIFEKYGVSAIYGFHLFPFIEEGVISTKPGPMMAMTSEFYVTIDGMSSHAGDPEKGIDAIVAGAAFVSGIQTVLTRNIRRDETTLINIGTFEGGERMNIVPGQVKISGTMRSYNADVQETMRRRMREMLEGIDLSYGTKSELNIVDMYPPVRNDEELFEELWPEISAPKKKFEKVMLAEDFALYQKHLPGLFMGLGTKNEDLGYTAELHTPGFNFNESVLLRGTDLYLTIIEA